MNKLRISLRWLFLLFVAAGIAFTVASCTDELPGIGATADQSYFNLRNINDQNNLREGVDSTADDSTTDCFTITYPVTVLYPDGSTALINNDNELEAAANTWLLNNPEAEMYPTFQFPITVTLEDGTTTTIADEEELCMLFEDCYGDFDIFDDCYDELLKELEEWEEVERKDWCDKEFEDKDDWDEWRDKDLDDLKEWLETEFDCEDMWEMYDKCGKHYNDDDDDSKDCKDRDGDGKCDDDDDE